MLTDRYGLSLSTASADARDAYVEGCDLALTFYPGAVRAYDHAIAADPGFALAHAGKAQVLMREGNVAAARAALAAAKETAAGLSDREASHIAFFDLAFAGRTDAAIAALYTHLTVWPRDALIVSSGANPNGLIGGSGRIGQKRQIATLMDSLAPHYGDDFWFLSYHAMALSEDGQLAAARAKIEQSLATEPEQCARCAWLRSCLLREWRAGHGPHLSIAVARRLSARRLFLRSSELASFALSKSKPATGTSAAVVSRRHRPRPAQRRAATENLGWGGVFVAFRTRRPAARCRGLARLYDYAARRCRGRAAGSPTCTSSWRRPSWVMTPRSKSVLARSRNWPRRALPVRLLPSGAGARLRGVRTRRIFPRRSRRSLRSPEKTNASAAAARSTT